MRDDGWTRPERADAEPAPDRARRLRRPRHRAHPARRRHRPEGLDPARRRAGRFDRQVLVDRPDEGGRMAIQRAHRKEIAEGPDVDTEKVAALTPGFAGADLADVVDEAALKAIRREAFAVEMRDLEELVIRLHRRGGRPSEGDRHRALDGGALRHVRAAEPSRLPARPDGLPGPARRLARARRRDAGRHRRRGPPASGRGRGARHEGAAASPRNARADLPRASGKRRRRRRPMSCDRAGDRAHRGFRQARRRSRGVGSAGSPMAGSLGRAPVRVEWRLRPPWWRGPPARAARPCASVGAARRAGAGRPPCRARP